MPQTQTFSVDKVEHARLAVVVNAITENFRSDLKDLLKKYDCEMTIAPYTYAGETVDGVEFLFGGIYNCKDEETVRPYFSINIGSYASKDCV